MIKIENLKEKSQIVESWKVRDSKKDSKLEKRHPDLEVWGYKEGKLCYLGRWINLNENKGNYQDPKWYFERFPQESFLPVLSKNHSCFDYIKHRSEKETKQIKLYVRIRKWWLKWWLQQPVKSTETTELNRKWTELSLLRAEAGLVNPLKSIDSDIWGRFVNRHICKHYFPIDESREDTRNKWQRIYDEKYRSLINPKHEYIITRDNRRTSEINPFKVWRNISKVKVSKPVKLECQGDCSDCAIITCEENLFYEAHKHDIEKVWLKNGSAWVEKREKFSRDLLAILAVERARAWRKKFKPKKVTMQIHKSNMYLKPETMTWDSFIFRVANWYWIIKPLYSDSPTHISEEEPTMNGLTSIEIHEGTRRLLEGLSHPDESLEHTLVRAVKCLKGFGLLKESEG